MRRGRRATAASCLLALVAGLIPFMAASPAGAVSAPQVVATGLNNPYKLSFGPDGDLYVAEAGTGGAGPCVEAGDEEAGKMCIGETGSVTRVVDGTGAQSRVVTGLPSMAAEGGGGNDAIGASDVQVDADGAINVVIGLGGNDDTRDAFGATGDRLGTVMRFTLATATQTATSTVLADMVAFEEANDPDKTYGQASEGIDSNPFAIERTTDGRLLVVDAGGNGLYEVAANGTVSLVTLFPLGPPAPLPGPPGGPMIPPQPVPTSVEQAPNGGIFVTELTGFPFPKGAADVFQVTGNSSSVAQSGFSSLIDLAFDAAGNMYVLELDTNGLLSGSRQSQLVQVRTDGTRKVLLSSELDVPGGVTVGPDGMIYVTNGSNRAGGGTVIRVDPRVARDAAIATACDPVKVKGSGFQDVARSVHQEAIECLKWWGLVNGLSATTFGTNRITNRGEVASLVGRLLERAGKTLPADPPDAFEDTDGNAHKLRINQLAAVGLVNGFGDGTYRPDRPIIRAEVASLLVRAYEFATGDDLAAGADKFTDDEGSTHEANINAAAGAGWVAGTTATTFSPAANTQRGQLASFTARMLSTLVTELTLTLPT